MGVRPTVLRTILLEKYQYTVEMGTFYTHEYSYMESTDRDRRRRNQLLVRYSRRLCILENQRVPLDLASVYKGGEFGRPTTRYHRRIFDKG